MEWNFIIYMAFGVLGIVLSYLGVRAIDYAFHKRDRKYDWQVAQSMSDRRYEHVKGCIRCYNDGQKRMTDLAVKTINDGLLAMSKELEDL